jgi:hypothetical protein
MAMRYTGTHMCCTEFLVLGFLGNESLFTNQLFDVT